MYDSKGIERSTALFFSVCPCTESIYNIIRSFEAAITDAGFAINFSDPISLADVQTAELALGFTFPWEYPTLITTHGLLYFLHLKSQAYLFDMLLPAHIVEDIAFAFDDQDNPRRDVVIFQKFGERILSWNTTTLFMFIRECRQTMFMLPMLLRRADRCL
ncbi:hypothetical protein [Pseudochryseolinea flava]|uniref:Uncharacterized protein n=1 Tax=Pseudochryseolinea flava TaxID=2059302 RepID=A0A364XVC9_9BACT|nr:hypothetical protein [Pseudochryseolinea flava]RAV97916.1 hypothetical protein DQQ10_25930 [Pseudochryseolinea flava]